MKDFFGLRLKLDLKDGSWVEGTVSGIDEGSQQLALKGVELGREGTVLAKFPELTVNGSEIENVEIISGCGNDKKRNDKKAPSRTEKKANFTEKTFSNNPANRAATFPTGNARQTLPPGDFDFAASLQRFNKREVFAQIAKEDLVRPEDRLVSINSPQRKLGINEDVLDAGEAKNSIVRATDRKKQVSQTASEPKSLKSIDPVTAKLMGINLTPVASKSPVLIVEEESSSEEDEAVETYGLPVLTDAEYDSSRASLNPQEQREQLITASCHLAHHLLDSGVISKASSLVALLGIEDESVVALELLKRLTRHARFNGPVLACFAVGGPGIKVELPPVIKELKAQLQTRGVQFISSLSDLAGRLKASPNSLVFDALRSSLLSEKSKQNISTLLLALNDLKLLGLNGSVLSDCKHLSRKAGITIVALGLPRSGVLAALPRAQNLLIVDDGRVDDSQEVSELFNETFVCEIDY